LEDGNRTRNDILNVNMKQKEIKLNYGFGWEGEVAILTTRDLL
jgi:hypothetical protein